MGIASSSRGLAERYASALIEAGSDLRGLTVVLDAAFGAAFEIGPYVLRQLGANVIAINAENDGSRINVKCGATDMGPLQAAVQTQSGSKVLGVAFDGDADRALFIDEHGEKLTGDHVMLILSREMQREGTLPRATVIGTVMSNVGLEVALKREGITLERTPVGDRYVLERMRAGDFRFGGEQSGHIIDLARNTTGDGLLTAVSLFGSVVRSGRTLHELAKDLVEFPQILVNVRVESEKEKIAGSAAVAAAIERAERELAGVGRILVRPSGTEPLVRVMLEGPDSDQIGRLAHDIADAIREATLA